ncbi:hypothetical protein FHL15_002578 [Xylaria flabelliformis]|uniref:Uncharacterized protein n=1 Tax=Xylaria flabelliformis TaxID=2512241 RepID=A0A553I7X8_9PEZI|nr:hypothetical protein FHL15_002578 [Xylaria flabelliformis]
MVKVFALVRHTSDKPGKPSNPPKQTPSKKDEGKKQDENKGSLNWLIEAANYEPPKQLPKSSGDWIEDASKIV